MSSACVYSCWLLIVAAQVLHHAEVMQHGGHFQAARAAVLPIQLQRAVVQAQRFVVV
jgi:hypothetical protein